jgi:NADH:ubiquinone oxidoreductase subunit E
MEPFRFHLFVCTQQKPEGVPSCPSGGSLAVLGALDHEIQARGLNRDVQLTTCGCMGLCDEGPVMVVYPTGTWYRRV